MIPKPAILKNLFFWVLAFCLLAFIYGTAFGSYQLGIIVILLLLPVHMLYFHLIANGVLPRYFFPGKYLKAFFATLAIMAFIAVLYRFVEVFITDPYIYRFYKTRDNSFTWAKLSQPWWRQMTYPVDFVNAIERSNVIVWICVTLKIFTLWHERKQAVLQAELNILKGQLHPHFLFNALNNLYALSLDNAPQTPGIILGLSNILRYVLYECTAEQVPLKRDVEVLSDYIRLEQLRYEERLELNVNITGLSSDRTIAPLLMLPLVENAFKHGAAEAIDTPWINIELKISGDDLILKISNSKPEDSLTCIDGDPVIPAAEGMRPSGQIGLANVRKRLALLYPDKHSFTHFDAGDCFITELNIQLTGSQKKQENDYPDTYRRR